MIFFKLQYITNNSWECPRACPGDESACCWSSSQSRTLPLIIAGYYLNIAFLSSTCPWVGLDWLLVYFLW